MKHVDDWLDEGPRTDPGEEYAREFLEHARRPAAEKDHKWLSAHPLFCTYAGSRYRCTGASRLGDVWLANDYKRDTGYDLRVDIANCSQWSAQSHPEGREKP